MVAIIFVIVLIIIVVVFITAYEAILDQFKFLILDQADSGAVIFNILSRLTDRSVWRRSRWIRVVYFYTAQQYLIEILLIQPHFRDFSAVHRTIIVLLSPDNTWRPSGEFPA